MLPGRTISKLHHFTLLQCLATDGCFQDMVFDWTRLPDSKAYHTIIIPEDWILHYTRTYLFSGTPELTADVVRQNIFLYSFHFQQFTVFQEAHLLAKHSGTIYTGVLKEGRPQNTYRDQHRSYTGLPGCHREERRQSNYGASDPRGGKGQHRLI